MSLGQSIELISSLISLSHSIKVFPVKWQSIHRKLGELLSGLNAVEIRGSGENPSVTAVVRSMKVTIDECYGLARRCLNLSYSGKLLMQSDLDIVSSKLESHVKSLSDAYNLGLLAHSYAIVVPRPGPAASREDMRFYAHDLLSRLKIGSTDMKRDALAALGEILQEDDRYVKIVILEDGFIPLLVNLLDSQEHVIQEGAAKAISIIAGQESHRGLLVRAGTIQPLIRVLESGSQLGREYTAVCLQRMTENSDNAWSVSAHGGVTAILKVCSNSEIDGEFVSLACGVLKNLVGVEEIRRFMVEEGAISVLIKLARSKREASQISSMDLLQTMASFEESIRRVVVQEGGFRVMVRAFDPNTNCSSKAREIALRLIKCMCFSSVKSVTMLMNFGFMDHVFYFLKYGEDNAQELALKASFWLSGTCEEARRAMGEKGFIQELVRFLDSRSYEVREMSAGALSSMVLVPGNRRRFLEGEQNVGLLLRMLNPEEGNSGMRKLLLSILMSLTNCRCARRKIMRCGSVENIRRLAEAGISDAKAIVKKLSPSNRLIGIVTAFWRS